MSEFIICNSIKINTLDCPYDYEMYYSHSHSYFVRSSDTNDVTPDRISDKRNFQRGGCYQTICFDQEKVFVLVGNLQKL
jgi:hypothetical protein